MRSLATFAVIITVAFTSCKEDVSNSVKPGNSIYDFKGKYIISMVGSENTREFELAVDEVESFDGTVTAEAYFSTGARITDIYLSDSLNKLVGTIKMPHQNNGEILMFIHPDGSRRMEIITDKGKVYEVRESGPEGIGITFRDTIAGTWTYTETSSKNNLTTTGVSKVTAFPFNLDNNKIHFSEAELEHDLIKKVTTDLVIRFYYRDMNTGAWMDADYTYFKKGDSMMVQNYPDFFDWSDKRTRVYKRIK